MDIREPSVVPLALALGIGLLIGFERERSKQQRAGHEPAGVRTFALTALVGGVSLLVGDVLMFAVAAAVIGLLVDVGFDAAASRIRA